MSTTITPAPSTPSPKSTFWSAFKNTTEVIVEDVKDVALIAEKDTIIEAKTIGKDILNLAEYTADKAALNVKSEVTKIQTLVNSKLSQIESKNKSISAFQADVTVLEADVAKAKALAEKLVAAVS